MRTTVAISLVWALCCWSSLGFAQDKEPAKNQPKTNKPQLVGATNSPSLRLRRLEQRIQVLKEEAWRAKARVGMLKESVLGGDAGHKSTIIHRNNMGAAFRMDRVVYALDGHRVYAKSGPELHRAKSLEIFSGSLSPGNHSLSVYIVYKGHGYGVLSYLNGYRFTVRRNHTFMVKDDRTVAITVIGYEQGDPRTKHEDRPSLDFRVVETVRKPPSKKKTEGEANKK